MKRRIVLFLAAVWLLSLAAGCESGTEMAAPSDTASPVASELPSASLWPSDGVDVDLTAMSSTMVYAEVSNMVWEPEGYVGKMVKIRGEHAVYHDEVNDEYYHAVIITDALACCAQGLEFVWRGEHKYPDDYPEEGAEIELIGSFQIGQAEGYSYIYIETDELVLVA